MFVVSILDGGDERNFLATGLTFQGESVFIDAAGVRHRFRRADILEIVSVNDADTSRDLPRPCCGWHPLSELLPETATRQ